ncbi:MAG: metal-dependent hydrolase [Myxococcota bacterium]
MPASTVALSKSRIPIVPRRMDMGFDDVDEEVRFFFEDNSILTTLLVALSGVFPPGEKEFIQSVRLFMGQVHDEQLLRHVKEFAAQEGHHALQHRTVNAIFDRLGYPASGVSAFLEEKIERWTHERSDEERLAVTVVMEHLTATMAHFALQNPERFDSLPASMRELIFWHAIEEIEHKSVAFDVYDHCVGQKTRIRRRVLMQMVLFPFGIGTSQLKMLIRFRHVPRLREVLHAAKFLWGRGGLIPSVLPNYLAMLKPGFHPWDIDDSALVGQWKARLQLLAH